MPDRFDPNRPHLLPALPPMVEVETKAVLRSCIEANRALAELKGVTGIIPNSTVLINAIPLREAKDSSEIENIVTTSDALFRHAGDGAEGADAATRETLRYRTALLEGFREIRSRPLGMGTAIAVCRKIRNIDLDIRAVPGTALTSTRSGEIIYTPPEGAERLRDLLSNWEKFLHAETPDPLIRMAIAHYQFEAIHPFTDGNGRTGRVLNILHLVDQGLLDLPVLYLSRYLIDHKADYYRLLLAVTRDGAWEEWILYMLDAVAMTAIWTRNKITAIRALLDHTCEYAHLAAPTAYSRELVESCFIQPYCRIQTLVERGIAKRQTASHYLKALARAGILEEVQIGREKLFINRKFVTLLMGDSNDFTPYG